VSGPCRTSIQLRLKYSRSHLWEDLAPYICLMQVCPTPTQAFSTKHAWLDHVRTQHTEPAWRCSQCTEVLKDEQGFRVHVRQHERNMAATEIDLAVRFCQLQTSFDACIICGLRDGFVVGDQDTTHPGSLAHQQNILTCMLNHLENLALSCLPWHFGAEGEAAGSIKAEATTRSKVEQSLQLDTTSTSRRKCYDQCSFL
jgi:hypothetical protein